MKPFPFYYKTLPPHYKVRRALKERSHISADTIGESWFTICRKNQIFQMWNEEYIKGLAKEILTLMDDNSVLEVCAGDGMLSHWLRIHDVNIKATDDMSWHRQSESWVQQHNHTGAVVMKAHSEVEELDAISAVRKYKPRMILTSWIPCGSEIDCEILDEGPEYLILIGENSGGCTGSSKFWGDYYSSDKETPPAYWKQKGYTSEDLNIDMWNICRTDYDWNYFSPHSCTKLYSRSDNDE